MRIQLTSDLTEMAKTDGLTEEMKNTNPLRWVGMMNNYKSCAEEVILNELIFA